VVCLLLSPSALHLTRFRLCTKECEHGAARLLNGRANKSWTSSLMTMTRMTRPRLLTLEPDESFQVYQYSTHFEVTNYSRCISCDSKHHVSH
jgi:hypothetical protein